MNIAFDLGRKATKQTNKQRNIFQKPTKVLQETLHNLYDTVSQARTAHVQDEITLEMAPIDFDFKRKHKEVG